MLYRAIGLDQPVSALSLGSWNTFSRLTRDECAALLAFAVERGVNLFDVGYYWDKPDTEQEFAAAVHAAGLARDQYMLALKLWLWNYPQQSLAEQARASMHRLGVNHVDIVMVSRPTPGVDFEAFCREIDDLVSTGIARAWGATNWEPEQLEAARAVLQGRAQPRLVQLQYNVARRNVVEDERYLRLFQPGQLALCAAFVLEGGILAGHLDRDRVNPSDFARGERPRERNIARDAGGVREQIRAHQHRLQEIAHSFGASAAQLAIAFTLANPATATALIGVTKLTDLEENLGALRLLASQQEWLPLLEPLRVAAAHPRLFDPVKHE
jgi:Predicted oxidoreductases (related to aryl-alcohol dehydrogenases)